MSVSVWAAGLTLASQPLAENNFGDVEKQGMAGPLGLVIIVLLAIVTVLLVRNMNRRLRHLPTRFPVKQESDTDLSPDGVSRQDHSHQDQMDQGEVADDGRQRRTGANETER